MVLETLFGSKLRTKVMGWLFSHPDQRYFVRQLTGLLSEDSTNVSRELSRLEKTGILVSISEGRQKYYQANRNNPLFNDLHGLIVKTAGLADALRSALQPEKSRIKAAFVFGSIARGNETRRSDIDVMVIGNIAFERVLSLFSTTEPTLGREVNPVVYSAAEFRQKLKNGDHFVKTVLDGEKTFLIGDEHELGRIGTSRPSKST